VIAIFLKDKFLRAQAAQNEQGYVPISTIATFNKMQVLKTDLPQIVKALKNSSKLDVNDEGTMVKRRNPLPELDTSLGRTIYAKGFPTEGTKIDDISKCFISYGNILSVRIRKTEEKKLKPSAFIEFSTDQEAKSAAMADPKPKFNETELIVMMKNDYVQNKKEQKKKEQELKKRKVLDNEKPEGNNPKKYKQANENQDGKEEKEEQKEEVKEGKHKEEAKDLLIPGLILQVKNIGPGTTREILKEIFGKYGKIGYIDFSQNQIEGCIRFSESGEAQTALDSILKEKIEIHGQVPELSLLEGEAEKLYYEKVKQFKSQQKRWKKKRRKRRNKS